LDEWKIRDLLDGGAPIDGFGVGTGMGVSADAPSLDIAYKLTSYAGRGRLKLSSGKPVLPGRKQVFRREEDGVARADVIGRAHERLGGRPLMRKVMEGGGRLPAGKESLDACRERARDELIRLPPTLHALEPSEPYPVRISRELERYRDSTAGDVAAAQDDHDASGG
jgi:nicotinate phosphoribosyltransferase